MRTLGGIHPGGFLSGSSVRGLERTAHTHMSRRGCFPLLARSPKISIRTPASVPAPLMSLVYTWMSYTALQGGDTNHCTSTSVSYMVSAQQGYGKTLTDHLPG